MNTTAAVSPIRNICLACLIITCLPVALVAETLSVQQWNAMEQDWGKFAKSEETFTIEGWVSTLSESQLRLLKCKLKFRASRGRKFKRPARKSFNASVTGHLQNKAAGLEFIVTRIITTKVDLDEYAARAERIVKNSPDAWVALADWAEKRGAFYNDSALQNKANDARLRSIQVERFLLQQDDYRGLYLLADKLLQLKLSEPLRQEYLHEAMRSEWSTQIDGKPELTQPFLRQLNRLLPGCKVPEDKPDKKLQAAYKTNPLATYQKSDSVTRKRLHRIFYRTLLFADLTRDYKNDPRLGYALAERIEELIPEEQLFAEKLRVMELDFREKHLATATRQQLNILKEKLIARNNKAKATQVVQKWLTAREAQLRKEGSTGLVRAAGDYLDLAEDKENAIRLFKEAYKMNAKTPGIIEPMRKLGYYVHKDKWLTKAEMDNLPVDPIVKAIKEGRVITGMTKTQVEKTLGAPTTRYRIFTSGQFAEVWVMGARKESRLAIHFLQTGKESTSSKVVRIDQIQPR